MSAVARPLSSGRSDLRPAGREGRSDPRPGPQDRHPEGPQDLQDHRQVRARLRQPQDRPGRADLRGIDAKRPGCSTPPWSSAQSTAQQKSAQLDAVLKQPGVKKAFVIQGDGRVQRPGPGGVAIRRQLVAGQECARQAGGRMDEGLVAACSTAEFEKAAAALKASLARVMPILAATATPHRPRQGRQGGGGSTAIPSSATTNPSRRTARPRSRTARSRPGPTRTRSPAG